MKNKFQLNLATGMAMGAIVAALISIVVQLTRSHLKIKKSIVIASRS